MHFTQDSPERKRRRESDISSNDETEEDPTEVQKKKKNKKHGRQSPEQELKAFIDVDVKYSVFKKRKGNQKDNGMVLVKLPTNSSLADFLKMMRKDYLSGVASVRALPMYDIEVSISGDKHYDVVSEVAWRSTIQLVFEKRSCLVLKVFGSSISLTTVKQKRRMPKTGHSVKTLQQMDLNESSGPRNSLSGCRK